MKLGEMLVRDGRITEADLEATIAQQATEGGRLGSLLVQRGHIDVETLTVYLGLELGIPIATGATLERCKRSAVRLLTPEQANRFRCVPIVIQGQTVIVAMDDPHDIWTLDQLAQLTGYRVIPRVVPEIRLYFYIERFYGIPRPPHFRRLGDAVRGNREAVDDQGLPAPPLPGLPPIVAKPETAPTPAPVVRKAAPAAAPAAPRSKPPAVPETSKAAQLIPEGHEALELDAADLVEELDADDADAAERIEAGERPEGIAKGQEVSHAIAAGAPQRYEAISADEAIARMKETDKRTTIADSLLSYAASLFDVGVLLLLKDNLALGWRGFGPGLDENRIEPILIPLDAPSIFYVALEGNYLHRGRAFPTTVHRYWYKVLRTEVPNYSIVIVVAIGRRPVNLLYGHRADGKDLTDEQVADLRKVATAAGQAYVRLITVSKKRLGSDVDAVGEAEQAGASAPADEETAGDGADDAGERDPTADQDQ